MNIHLISGNDEAQIREQASSLALKLAGPEPDAFALEVFQEDDGGATAELVYEVIRSLKSPPFLGNKTVWLKNFSGFESEGEKDSSSAPLAVALRQLAELLRSGLPDNINVLIDGPKLDRRRALCRAGQQNGQVRILNRPDLKDRNWQQDMLACIEAAAQEKGVRMQAGVANFMVDALGNDTARIQCELEKLICYCGGTDQTITLAAAQQVCTGKAEEMPWIMAEVLGQKSFSATMRAINSLIEQSDDPSRSARSLMINAASYFRQLLQLQALMEEKRLKTPIAVNNFLKFLDAPSKKQLFEQGLEAVELHPYRAQKLSENLRKYSTVEMIKAIKLLRDALHRCMTSSTTARIALEEVMAAILAGNAARK